MVIVYLLIIMIALAGQLLCLKIITEKSNEKVIVCPINKKGTCDTVLKSSYSKTFGIPNELHGFFYYGFVLVCYLALTINYFGWTKDTFPNILVDIVSAGGFVVSVIAVFVSLYFTYIQAFVLKQWCSYCVTSALFTIIIFVLSVYSGGYAAINHVVAAL